MTLKDDKKSNKRILTLNKQINDKRRQIENEEIKIKKALEYCLKYQLLKDPRINIILLHEILKYREEKQADKKTFNEDKYKHKLRFFTLVPNKKGFTVSHIKICNTSFQQLIKRSIDFYKPKENVSKQYIKDNPDIPETNIFKKIFTYKISEQINMTKTEVLWNKLFNVPEFEKGEKIFVKEIVTDGKAVSITLKRLKRNIGETETESESESESEIEEVEVNEFEEADKLIDEIENEILSESGSEAGTKIKSKLTFDEKNWKNYVACDPGVTKAIVMINYEGKTVNVSTKEYYHNAKFNESNNFIRKKQERNKEIDSIYKNMPSCKTSSLEKFTNYLNYLLPKLNLILNYNKQRFLRDQRFKRYCFSKREISRIADKVINVYGSDVIIGFGNFSNNGCIRKIKGPVLKIKKELERKCKVVSVDEFRTSKLCHECKCPLEHRKSHKTRTKKKIKKYLESGFETKEIKNENIHSVLYCKNNNCVNCSITVDRDFSAVLNILEQFYCNLKGLINPAFSRKRDLKIPFTVDPIYNFTAY